MKKAAIVLSICIPTYNRSSLLHDCLTSIISQFKNEDVYNKVEVVISNNNSPDDTEKVVEKFQKKFRNVYYYKNRKNIKSKNTMKVAEYAKGDYIWFFSDDDLHQNESLSTVLSIIKKDQPDALTVNLDLWSKDMKTLLDPNLLRLTADVLIKNKKELFSLLETKFFLPIDWYLTTYSNTILKRSIFTSDKELLNKYKQIAGIFPQKLFLYYKTDHYRISFIKKSLIKFRADNRSFGSNNQNEFLAYWYRVLPLHYHSICRINKKNISPKFLILLYLKNLTRSIRLLFLKIFKYDISTLLMNLFYKKSNELT